ncbi:MAG: T9SS type A sorting domain-containing protein, partial [Elusimicrobiota bacterium]
RQIEIPLIDLTIFQPLSLTMSPIIVAKGATVKGTVLDAVTGSSVGNSNVRVHIEARPWVDGSSRDTGTGSGDVQISTGMFTFKNLPGGTYILDIQTRVGSDGKVNGKNYIAYFKAGIVVPNEAIEVDVGSVKLKEGVTITGKVVDMSAKPLANIKIMAKPSEKMGESIDLIATTNEFGEYTINSINPDVKYWDVTAGIRDSGDTSVSRYGAVTMRSVIQGSKDVNFKLEEAPGILRGLIKIEEGYRMITPVSGYEIPGALVLLQKKGVEYKNPMDGIETASKPPKDVEEYSVVHQEAEFEVKGLVPGEYIIKVFVKGLATATKDITVVGGINNLTEAIELKGGGTVLGGISKTNGSKITTNDATMAVAVSEDFTKMVFGYFTVNQTTLEIDSYTITGLEPSVKYFIALSQTNGEVFVAPGQVMVNSARAVVSKNLTYQPHPLKFKVKAFRKQRGRNISFTLTILASAPLVEGDPTKLDTLKEIVTLSSPTVQEAIDAFDVISMSLDKQMLVCTYLPGDETEFSIRTKGTDAEGNTGDETSTFPIDIKSKNEEKFNPISGGEVKVGEGNTSGMYIPAGTFNSTGTVTAEVIVESTITNTGSAAIAKAYMAASNLPGVQASEVYNMQVKIVNGPLAKLASGKTVKVTIQYSTLTVTNTDLAKLYVYQLNSDGSWSKVTNGMNIDTVSNTISVESGANSSGNVSGKFAAFIGSAQTSGGDGSGTYAGPFKTYVYPNPFKPATDTNANIRYFIPAGETNLEVTIKIFNIAGELVREFDKVTLVATGANNGYTATWDGTNQKSEKVASGVYIYKFKAGTHTDTKRIAVIR